MKQSKTVLIAVDLEGQPEQVLTGAKQFIQSGDRVHVLTVTEDPTYYYAGYGTGGFVAGVPIPTVQELTSQAETALSAVVDSAELQNVTIHVDLGRPADVILTQADTVKADLVIVGSHGRHGIGLLLGSTANYVLHRVKCDVLAVRVRDDVEDNK